jgi:pimeloyl-ACP methyl ester carboxylesterase
VRIVLLHAFPLDPGMWEPQRALLGDHDVLAPSISLQVPLLVVAGDSDPIIDAEHARQLAASAPLGQFHLVESAGHLPSLERPGDFNQALGEFLASL